MATTQIKDPNNDNQAFVSNAHELFVTGVGVNNGSIGNNGSTAPTQSSEIAGIDPSGNLHPVSVDSTGAVYINSTAPIATTELGLNHFQTSQYAIGTTAVQLTPVPLANRSSASIRIQAANNVAVYIGNDASVTPSTGYPLYDRDSLELDLTPTSTIYAVSTIAGQVVAVLEIA